MRMTSSICVLFVGITVIAFCQHGLATMVEITPTTFNGLTPTTFTVSCAPNEVSTSMMKIIAIQLFRNNRMTEPIANLQGIAQLSFNKELASSINHTEGQIDKNVKDSKLSVMFSEAKQEDSALYTCRIVYIDVKGMLHMDEKSQNFAIDKWFVSAFRADYNTTDKATKGSSPTSIEVHQNIGLHLDEVTGIYTAPSRGSYVFHLSALPQSSDSYLRVHIRVNSSYASYMFGREKNYADLSSVSAVVSLQEGDTAWPHVRHFDGGNKVKGHEFSTFSGYLLRPL